jgi:hypothetical protein
MRGISSSKIASPASLRSGCSAGPKWVAASAGGTAVRFGCAGAGSIGRRGIRIGLRAVGGSTT